MYHYTCHRAHLTETFAVRILDYNDIVFVYTESIPFMAPICTLHLCLRNTTQVPNSLLFGPMALCKRNLQLIIFITFLWRFDIVITIPS